MVGIEHWAASYSCNLVVVGVGMGVAVSGIDLYDAFVEIVDGKARSVVSRVSVVPSEVVSFRVDPCWAVVCQKMVVALVCYHRGMVVDAVAHRELDAVVGVAYS